MAEKKIKKENNDAKQNKVIKKIGKKPMV